MQEIDNFAQCSFFTRSVYKTLSDISNTKIMKRMQNGLFRFWKKCCIPEQESYERAEASALESRRSPADWLGRQSSCFYCIPMKVACSLICVLSFIWASLELQRSEDIIAKLIGKENEFYHIATAVYSLCAFIFLLGAASLLLGILTNSYTAVHLYVWIAFCYNCMIMSTCVYTILMQLLEAKKKDRYQPIAIVAAGFVLFHSMVFYCIAVVNTFEVYARMYAMSDFVM